MNSLNILFPYTIITGTPPIINVLDLNTIFFFPLDRVEIHLGKDLKMNSLKILFFFLYLFKTQLFNFTYQVCSFSDSSHRWLQSSRCFTIMKKCGLFLWKSLMGITLSYNSKFKITSLLFINSALNNVF